MRKTMRGGKMRARSLSLLLALGLPIAMCGLSWAAEAGGHGGGHELNWTDFMLRLINFVILVAILTKLLKKPLVNFFSSRREDIQKLLSELELKRKAAEEKSAEYRAKMAALEGETKKIVDDLIAEGEVERQKIIDDAQRQAEYIKQQAQLAIQQEIKSAKETLQTEIAEMSVAAAEEILRKKMKSEDQERLVRDFMTKVVEAK